MSNTATSAGDSDVSNWAMRIQTNSGATFPVAIENEFQMMFDINEISQLANVGEMADLIMSRLENE